MKRSLLLFVLAACGAELSADPPDIFVAPLRLELTVPHPLQHQLLPAESSRLDRVISLFGPNSFGGSVPVVSRTVILKRPPSPPKLPPNLDAPGPGYREQLQRLYGP